MLECWLYTRWIPQRVDQAVKTGARAQPGVCRRPADAVVEEDDRSEGGFGLQAFRCNLLISYSDPLWAGLGIILAAQSGGDWLTVLRS